MSCSGAPPDRPDAGSDAVADAETSADAAADAGSDAAADADADASDAGPDSDAGADGAPDASEDADAGADADAGPVMRDPPPLPVYSGAACPTLIAGHGVEDSVNPHFTSGGSDRQFRLLVPTNHDPSQAWPVVFAWHWLNASSGSFVRDAELATAHEEMGIIFVLPDSLKNSSGNGVYQADWPYVETWGAEKELVFFEDLLACVHAKYNVDPRRVYQTGVSAGGLWVTYLSGTERVDRVAAVVPISGGLGELSYWKMPWSPQPNKFPSLIIWGGPTDQLGLDFHEASLKYRDVLLADGHFVATCMHDAGHGVPPFEPPEGHTKFYAMWKFMLDHPYGLPAGTSPYLPGGLPDFYPDFCSIPAPP
jgi:hypothetical protein